MPQQTLNHTEIAQRIPHTGNMCLLDTVVLWSKETIHCTATSHLHNTNPLRRHDVLAAIHLIEYAAQAMAVHGSLIQELVSEEKTATQVPPKPTPGRLVSVRDFESSIQNIAAIQEPLHIHCQTILSDSHSCTFSFEVKTISKQLAEGRASVMFVVN